MSHVGYEFVHAQGSQWIPVWWILFLADLALGLGEFVYFGTFIWIQVTTVINDTVTWLSGEMSARHYYTNWINNDKQASPQGFKKGVRTYTINLGPGITGMI